MTYTKINSTAQNARRRKHNFARIFLVSTIIISTIILIISIITSSLAQPERQVKDKITALATYYYENAFYQNLLDSPNFSGNPAQALERYQGSGLSVVTLRQLLLHDSAKNANVAKYLLNYCNENSTYVKFYPEPPFSRTDYHIDYTYSCNF